MTISYNWLSEYLPEKIEPEKLSKILTSIGLEVESLEYYTTIKGGLKNLIIGEILTCEQHPNADKLKVTKVNTGHEILQIVCGAENVAVKQKVIIATPGTRIYPTSANELTIKTVKIRGIESNGMICAEDEIGIGNDHSGIIVLNDDAEVGSLASEYFQPYNDFIFEIGLTPNRMDAMSHYGVARDVCAYLSHHEKKEINALKIFSDEKIQLKNIKESPVKIKVENEDACPRYAGVIIENIVVSESPKWLKDKLVAIGQKPINNIVDITNFILHEAGQPLHAFDADEIRGNIVVVRNAFEGEKFISLDEKERTLNAEDLVICNADEPMCIAGIFGGIKSGIKENTKNIFLESACFNSANIRRTAQQLGLRTEAAIRFEKGVDISNVVNVLKRAALLIKEVAGGEIIGDILDIYPSPKDKVQINLKYDYLKRLSGKNYLANDVKQILRALGFEFIEEDINEIKVAVPFSKTDISLPADLVEEIVRIDGLDNIKIPSKITISPSAEIVGLKEALKEKIAERLAGIGFHEIVTNSITNSNYFSDSENASGVKMLNSLSADLNILRPSMLETGLEIISYNINRKNSNILFFDFGKIYQQKNTGKYFEEEHLSLYISGNSHEDAWNEKSKPQDIFSVKGIANFLLKSCGFNNIHFTKEKNIIIKIDETIVGKIENVSSKKIQQFDLKKRVYFVDFYFSEIVKLLEDQKIVYKELSKFPTVQRDLAIVVSKNTSFENVENTIRSANIAKLQNIRLFDVFESEKIGLNKKSLAINFIFSDDEKTLTDKEIDGMVNKIIDCLETELMAEIRK